MTARRLIILPRAERDVRAAVLHYRDEGGASLARRFVAELERCYQGISKHPGIGSPGFGVMLDIPGLRSAGLAHFPYLVFYLELPDQLDVWRVLHVRRDLPTMLRDSD